MIANFKIIFGRIKLFINNTFVNLCIYVIIDLRNSYFFLTEIIIGILCDSTFNLSVLRKYKFIKSFSVGIVEF